MRIPQDVQYIISRLRAGGHEAYAVGGCVRDALLGREPNDWDVTTSALPEEMKACFEGHRLIETGLRHGTLTVMLGGKGRQRGEEAVGVGLGIEAVEELAVGHAISFMEHGS